ncbi:MAG: hypothetical protein WC449_03720 [Candidatus Paceibacterota bacterium]
MNKKETIEKILNEKGFSVANPIISTLGGLAFLSAVLGDKETAKKIDEVDDKVHAKLKENVLTTIDEVFSEKELQEYYSLISNPRLKQLEKKFNQTILKAEGAGREIVGAGMEELEKFLKPKMNTDQSKPN